MKRRGKVMSAFLDVYHRVQAELLDEKIEQFREFYNRYPTLAEESNLFELISDEQIKARMLELGTQGEVFEIQLEPDFVNSLKTGSALIS